MNDRPGCLSGLMKLLLLNWLFDWLQENFGFGRGGCMGCGCGTILFLIFVVFACSLLFGTDWMQLGF